MQGGGLLLASGGQRRTLRPVFACGAFGALGGAPAGRQTLPESQGATEERVVRF